MNIFVLNSGSSSIKYQLIDLDTEEVLARGLVERIGEPGQVPDHQAGIAAVLTSLGDARIDAIGHRVVHGGDRFDRAVIVTDEVEAAIEELSVLAPLHNPANLTGIRAARAAMPGVPNVVVFDTAFHQTLDAAAYTYAIPADLAREYGIRRYGFHGTSHKYVSERAAAFLGRPLEQLKIIVLHIGNGASATAIDGGRSIDTSMGMTPLEGLVMGTRSGDLDPAVVLELQRRAGLSVDEVDDVLNKRSGLLGLSGYSDERDVQKAAVEGDEAAEVALSLYRHRIRHYVGAYAAQLRGLDAIVFTGGVGENNTLVRRRVLRGLEFMGVHVDPDRNEVASKSERRISPDNWPVSVLVIPTNEELEIARQTAALI
ncbi:acetate kinase [Galbitalea sp. SE-J8]|uniref:acetate/propionate family kinase n=1 Tax=Galbitalea sp. SE-J8 TaxID=3054952 RepID=UPI00259D2706|nr:acetate kinase [Galbitalea sp. SE-J8]MDM4762514.1 acetate kinase [Galbitalea sp. SE-J8]